MEEEKFLVNLNDSHSNLLMKYLNLVGRSSLDQGLPKWIQYLKSHEDSSEPFILMMLKVLEKQQETKRPIKVNIDLLAETKVY